ncbi:hypothetical protein JMJ55_28200 [Belnapia sp. T6]|uniref:Uncharacterized protein n=1 Tax=Belnapia mucosa TaxID=2804532 RepID=A0ABS1VC03_9PROT|nr:hypothetical protein [Belnapia mucosa]MBL6459209.1 hypothetical protein [Belnapia mucosa]
MALEAERTRLRPQAERVPVLEAEVAALRDAVTREAARAEHAEAVLASWLASGPLRRAWTAFWRARS